MEVSAAMKWVGPAAIVGAWFTIISDQLGLITHLPQLGSGEPSGFHAVGSGIFLFVVTLLFVGLVGLHARHPDPRGTKVIEYGDGHARYVRIEFSEEELEGLRGPVEAVRDASG